MPVLIDNATATIRRRVEGAENAHGERVAEGWGAGLAMLPAFIQERGDGGFTIGLDDSLWPVRVGDLVVDGEGKTYLVQTTALLRNAADPTVDWIRTTALYHDGDGTDPGDVWFVGRREELTPGEVPLAASGMYTGHGAPGDIPGAEPGDEYLDLDTGDVYILGGA